MTAPYNGPFRVLERGPQGFRIQFPGRASDIVALARLKPAFVSRDAPANDSDSDQDLDNNVSPPPPPPRGRRPGLGTRVPEPTSRVTRSQRQNANIQPQPSTSSASDEPTCAPPPLAPLRLVTRRRSPSPDSSQDSDSGPMAPPAPPSPDIIRDPQFPDGTPDDPNLAVDPTPPRLARLDFNSASQQETANSFLLKSKTWPLFSSTTSP